jgi:hypothetical protein
VVIALILAALVFCSSICGLGTVWFSARYAGSRTALLDFIVWPIAFIGTLSVLAFERFERRGSLLRAIADHALKARERNR